MIAVSVLTVALIAVLLVGFRRERALLDEIASSRKEAASERAELLERIQRPERPPTSFQQDYHVPDREPDEWAKVGTIEHDPRYGLEPELPVAE